MERPSDPQDVTRLLQEWGSGNKDALDQLMPVVYDQLRKLAARSLYSERRDHTLRATELVNEVYVKLVHSDVALQDRMHFYALASRMLRHILLDYAKSQKRDKRGGDAQKITLDEAVMLGPGTPAGIVELDDALKKLAQEDQRKADLIELLFFGGLTYDEAAQALSISPATVHREAKLAKAWLYRELS